LFAHWSFKSFCESARSTKIIVNGSDTLRVMTACLLLAQSGHASCAHQCPLLGVKRT
jgi:hypothetical protein